MSVTRDPATPRGPLVSIVTPTYGRADLLRHTIASIRSQSYPNLEHIVVDGGSTDGTIELLKSQQDAYRLRWISEPDEGMYHAINKGLAIAQGEILAYLNSDDLYFPWSVEVAVDALLRHPEADFVHGEILPIDEDTGEMEIHWLPPFDLDYIRRVGFLSQAAVFWRRQAYEQLGPFDERLRYIADCEYWMRAGETHRFHKVNEFLAVERNHAGTLRQALSEKVWPELERVRSSYVELAGPDHQRRLRWHDRRYRFYRRLYSTTFLVQSVLPRPLRIGPWSRLPRSGHVDVQRLRLAIRLIPFLGPRLIRTYVAPSRYWLTQADRDPAIAPPRASLAGAATP